MKEAQSAGFRIESGPTRERIVRTALLLILLGGFGAAFVYDGWYGYPGENLEEHLKALPAEERDKARDARVYGSVRQESETAAKAVLNRIGVAEQRKALAALFGGPPSYESRDAWHYFGPAFRVKYELEGSEARRFSAQASAKSATSIRWQKVIGIVRGLGTVAVLIHLLRVLSSKAVLDADGLRIGRRPPIPWEGMAALEDGSFRKKGWVDLVYSLDGRTQRLRLDEYHFARFAEIVGRICEKKGFVDPVAAEKVEKQAMARGEAESVKETESTADERSQSN